MGVTFLSQIILILIAVAFFTLFERKLLGYIQNRKGPNKPGPIGLLVPFADAFKLTTKEIRTPTHANKILFVLSVALALLVPLSLWCVYPTPLTALQFKYS